MQPSRDISRLIEIMVALRNPSGGCPWDVVQTFETIAPFTIEEAYEVADAIERGSPEDLREELGDLLLQVVYHARMAEEAGLFAFGDVVEAVTKKMIRRHPHVFGDVDARSPDLAQEQWARIKAEERAEKVALRAARLAAEGSSSSEVDDGPSLLDTVPPALPALTLALKIQEKAATVGFDWKEAAPILDKLDEEMEEFSQAAKGGDRDRVEDEMGDLIFSLVNLSRHHRVDPEKALRRCVRKFRDRFGHIERSLTAAGRSLDEASLDEMEALWQEAKKAKRG
ncbi:nucleoside triphosphate pyrophosphohydrolase [Consotaella salsifontis]|uniref:Nucleoside triphosphate pyrophosphohydrolase n=1 Tax=Consotaella salsifontis TaxID=1365950 RepID=A0A1T4T0M3_9HYPH|nr:nucleoside triphosphate pyrophosphohydrolase [Consotaella salsifontis]SKA33889.1 ATP diphosphatase [Consotaella salsifontis]